MIIDPYSRRSLCSMIFWAALNSGELARRHFREIARIAGLLVPARPGGHKSTRQLQASSGLFYDVFAEFDPENLLLIQARTEVLERHMEFARLKSALQHMIEKRFHSYADKEIEPAGVSALGRAHRIAAASLRIRESAHRKARSAT